MARMVTTRRNATLGSIAIPASSTSRSRGWQCPRAKRPSVSAGEDLNEVIAAFAQDKTTVERGLFDEEIVPEELTQVRMGKIVKDRYPELSEEDREAVRQHAVAALNLTQKAKEAVLDETEAQTNGKHRADRRRPEVCDGRTRSRHRPDRQDQPLRRGLRRSLPRR